MYIHFRALAIKRKSEAEREEKRRQQILAKRREKQQEATEKFQRGHIQSRPGSGTSSTSMYCYTGCFYTIILVVILS
jgi:Flp pilus assembly protein TadB